MASMATGKVKKQNNSKYFFVLDEIEGSPEPEMEAAIDSNSKEGNSSFIEDSNLDLKPEQEKIGNTPEERDEGEIDSNDSAPASLASEQDKMGNNGEQPNETTAEGTVDMELDDDSREATTSENKIAPIIKLSFRDEEIEKRYKNLIVNFLADKIHPCVIVSNSENSLETEIYKEDFKKVIEKEILDFEVDATPDNRYKSKVPCYGRPCDVLLSDKPEDSKSKKNSGGASCFNCLGSHNLRDCPKPKDYNIINRNRMTFQQNSKNVKTSRYHLDENQKFSHLVPGQISRKLRKALNLHSDQQPEFIYKMRKMGYPPAWLEEARVTHSGVAIYNTKGVPMLEEDEEEGEIVPDGAKDKYDITKIIEFPGFNVPLPKNMKDETKHYKCPPMSDEQSKDRMINDMQPNAVKAYRKRSLKLTTEEVSSEKDSSAPASPSIEEMEEKKRKLLSALEDDGGSDLKLSQDEESSSNQEVEPNPSETVPATPVKEVGKIKQLDFGTPILKNVSPFSKLPSREQFSVNVSDVINFENLPDSTGKYKTMIPLIAKVREAVTKIQNE